MDRGGKLSWPSQPQMSGQELAPSAWKRQEVLQGCLKGTTGRALPGALLRSSYTLYQVPIRGAKHACCQFLQCGPATACQPLVSLRKSAAQELSALGIPSCWRSIWREEEHLHSFSRGKAAMRRRVCSEGAQLWGGHVTGDMRMCTAERAGLAGLPAARRKKSGAPPWVRMTVCISCSPDALLGAQLEHASSMQVISEPGALRLEPESATLGLVHHALCHLLVLTGRAGCAQQQCAGASQTCCTAGCWLQAGPTFRPGEEPVLATADTF